MTKPLALILVAALLTGCRPSESSSRQTIEQAERDWGASFVSADPAVSERILASDFVWVDAQGKHWNRAELIGTLHKQPGDLIAIKLNRLDLRFFGDVAVAQGSEASLLRGAEGKPHQEISDFTDVWVYRAGQWQIAVSQDASVPLQATPAP